MTINTYFCPLRIKIRQILPTTLKKKDKE